jgi:hypothetical protein
MDIFYYIKRYLKSVFPVFKSFQKYVLRDLKHFEIVRYDQSVFVLLITV